MSYDPNELSNTACAPLSRYGQKLSNGDRHEPSDEGGGIFGIGLTATWSCGRAKWPTVAKRRGRGLPSSSGLRVRCLEQRRQSPVRLPLQPHPRSACSGTSAGFAYSRRLLSARWRRRLGRRARERVSSWVTSVSRKEYRKLRSISQLKILSESSRGYHQMLRRNRQCTPYIGCER
jgi:hypothetical protein